jgi:DNA-binding NtrC family response regulator
MKALQARPWPGNVRELDGFIERSVIESAGPSLEIDDGDWPPPHDLLNPAPLSHRSLQEIERGHVLATLERLGWRIEGPGGAAEVLGINASTLRSRMRKLGIRRPGRLADASRN